MIAAKTESLLGDVKISRYNRAEHASTDIACMCWFMAAAFAGNDGDLLIAHLFCIFAEHDLMAPENRIYPGCNTDSPATFPPHTAA